ncbi:hypothetical protein CpipJ_CPIJ017845 [Culex quinquefasciatus]|uniref:Uncharacterized protein n=1 Tax=Culex quinquefasciatus TaxID=7176 RepID=B0XEI1_CULQU|nr:hypothetical protein CpipJ_CPIJ017845 [Culex quinquefasciatus]|eukprot:XP_001868053.1 hypothetical protein CpipJ_CPIJ017845 [Culex quinquefasciatus]
MGRNAAETTPTTRLDSNKPDHRGFALTFLRTHPKKLHPSSERREYPAPNTQNKQNQDLSTHFALLEAANPVVYK